MNKENQKIEVVAHALYALMPGEGWYQLTPDERNTTRATAKELIRLIEDNGVHLRVTKQSEKAIKKFSTRPAEQVYNLDEELNGLTSDAPQEDQQTDLV